MQRQITKTHKLVLCALFTALIVVGAFIKIPVPIVPFTLQLLFTTLAGLLLGGTLGATSVFTYIVLGLVGLPIFAGGGGLGYLLKPSFGYTIGFMVGAYVTGRIANRVATPSYKRLFAAAFAGLGVIYVIGVVYLYLITTLYLGKDIGLWALLFNYCIIFIPTDSLKCILAVVIAKRLIPYMNNAGGRKPQA